MSRTKNTYKTVSRGGTRISNDSPGKRALLFNEVLAVSNNKNVFDLSHGVTMSGKMGNLMPLNVIKCVPGDIHKIGNESLVRLAPMISPPMQQMNFSIHNWFIPSRILWQNFEEYIIGEGGHAMPYINVTNTDSAAVKKFLDYMGIPPIPVAGVATQINALPLAAYQYLYNEKYRDQNLIAEVTYQLGNGNNTGNADLTTLRKVAWEHDLYTSALPEASFGAEVDIPLGDVQLKADWITAGAGSYPRLVDNLGNMPPGSFPILQNPGTGGITTGAPSTRVALEPEGSLEVAATTIKDLRQALKKQEFLELLARGGKRYYEVMERMWDVQTSDERYQQPEWISGCKTPIIISEVLNTTGTDDAPQGNMAGHGISLGNENGNSFFCEEYGYIISVCFCTPKSGYSQGIPKHWLEFDHYDYGSFIQFEHIGEQELTTQEIFAYTANKDNVFGYVPRYAHLKYMQDRIAGEMRTTLDHWTMTRTFATEPALNQDFIEVDPDDESISRVFAVTDGSDYLYIDVWNNIRSTRPFSVFGNPQL